jgi:hypothetical protein
MDKDGLQLSYRQIATSKVARGLRYYPSDNKIPARHAHISWFIALQVAVRRRGPVEGNPLTTEASLGVCWQGSDKNAISHNFFIRITSTTGCVLGQQQAPW